MHVRVHTMHRHLPDALRRSLPGNSLAECPPPGGSVMANAVTSGCGEVSARRGRRRGRGTGTSQNRVRPTDGGGGGGGCRIASEIDNSSAAPPARAAVSITPRRYRRYRRCRVCKLSAIDDANLSRRCGESIVVHVSE